MHNIFPLLLRCRKLFLPPNALQEFFSPEAHTPSFAAKKNFLIKKVLYNRTDKALEFFLIFDFTFSITLYNKNFISNIN